MIEITYNTIEALVDKLAAEDTEPITGFDTGDMNYHELKTLSINKIMQSFAYNTSDTETVEEFTGRIVAALSYLVMDNFVLTYRLAKETQIKQ